MRQKTNETTRFPDDSSGKLFDAIKKEFGLEKEGEGGLSEFLGVDYTRVSKTRHGVSGMTDSMRVAAMRATGWSLEKIDKLVGHK